MPPHTATAARTIVAPLLVATARAARQQAPTPLGPGR